MDIDRGLVAAVLREGLAEFLSLGVKATMLEGEGGLALRFVENHFREYGAPPSFDLVLRETGVECRGVPVEPVAFWGKEIRKRFLYNSLKDGLGLSIDKLEKRDPEGSLSDLRSLLFQLDNEVPSEKIESVFSNVDQFREAYERSKLGLIGLPSPWSGINDLTQGWQPEDLAVIAARPAQGKTWLLLQLAKWPWELGHRVLIGSTEMSKMALRRRFAALITKSSYGRLRRGKLTTMEEDVMWKKMKELETDDKLLVMGDGMSVTLESIEAAIMQTKPDLVCIDGIYLVGSATVKGRSRFEMVGEIMNKTKDLAKRTKVPIIVTSQLNRAPGGKGGGNAQKDFDLERLAFSDNMGMVADYVFFMKQDQKQKSVKQMALQPGKVREAEILKDVVINWNFETQDFSQAEDPETGPKGAPDETPKTVEAIRDDLSFVAF